MSYIVDDVVYFVCCATSTGKGLEVRSGLTQRKGPNQNSEEHLGNTTSTNCYIVLINSSFAN